MIVYHMYVLVCFVHQKHQSFVAVIENEQEHLCSKCGREWKSCGQDVLLCWRGCFGKVIQQQTGVCVE